MSTKDRKRLSLVNTTRLGVPSDVAVNIQMYVARKSANTRSIYLGISKDWSRFLGVEFLHTGAGQAWKDAGHTDCQRYLLEVGKRKAQPGRSAQNHELVSDSTIAYKVTILFALYEELFTAGIVSTNPWAKLKREYKSRKAGDRRPHSSVDAEKVADLIKAPEFFCAPTTGKGIAAQHEMIRDHAMMCLLFGAGLRRSEVAKLRLSDIQTTSAGTIYLHLRDTKSGGNQQLAIADWIGSAIERLAKQRLAEGGTDTSPLFVTYYNDATPNTQGMSDSTLYRAFKAICKVHGLPSSITPHCARATFITRLLDSGCNHRDIAVVSRHASVQMVERYDKRRVELDQAVSLLIDYTKKLPE